MSEDAVPTGWQRVTVKDVADVQLGKMLDAAKHTRGRRFRYLRNANVRWGAFDLSDLNEMFFEADELEHYSLKEGDLLVCEGGEPGRAGVWTGPDSEIKFQKALLRIRTGPRALSAWLMYALRLDALNGRLENYFTGSTIKHFPRQSILKYEFPLPVVAEQKRILAKVEELLARVDAARERITRVPVILRRFRQAVLAAACDGMLTENWRHAVGLTAPWRKVLLSQVSESRLGKMLDKAKNVGKQMPYLRNINVRWFGFDLSDVLNLRATDREIEELGVKPGDVLVCEGGEPGRCAVWRGKAGQVVYQKALHRVRVGASLSPDYLCYALKNAAEAGALEDLFTGSTIKHLTGVSLAHFALELPPVEEQKEIVRRVDALFKLADAIEKRAAVATARADRLTQAILAKAFRGELVPTEAELARSEKRGCRPVPGRP